MAGAFFWHLDISIVFWLGLLDCGNVGVPHPWIRLIILNCFHCLTDKVKEYVLELLSQNKPFLPWTDSSDFYHRNKKRNLKPYLANEASGHFNIETAGHTNLYIHIIWFGVLMFIHIYIIICVSFLVLVHIPPFFSSAFLSPRVVLKTWVSRAVLKTMQMLRSGWRRWQPEME